MKPFYITTPIYYVNDAPHIGHAYTSLACDVLARFKRLDHYHVKFLTGTDEHGLKIETSARDQNIPVGEFVDINSKKFRDLIPALNLSPDDFIRTTEERHIKRCVELWNTLEKNGFIYLGYYKGWYAIRDEQFYDRTELKDIDGKMIAPSGAECTWVETPSYFFKLSHFEKILLDFYEENPNFITPKSKRNEVISMVRSGLTDLSISRTKFKWGIPVPNDNNHVMYVWVDALTNYISAIQGKEEYWDNVTHVIGKDILKFHTIYWPALLLASGIKPPTRVFAHGWWTVDGKKMSKSLHNVISPSFLIDTYGLDQTRYFLLREMPFGNDGDFSDASIVTRINNELSNEYGNLVQRVLSFVNKYCDSKIPYVTDYTEDDNTLLDAAYKLYDVINPKITNLEFHIVLDDIWSVIRLANKYITEEEPWKLKQSDIERMNTVLYVLLETIRNIAIITQPFIPHSSSKILDMLNVPQNCRDFYSIGSKQQLIPGDPINTPTIVFPRYQK